MSSIVITKTPGNPTLAFDAMAEHVIKIAGTYYTTYRKMTGGIMVVGLAHASSPAGPWTDDGTILTRNGSGWETSGAGIDTSCLLVSGGTVYLFYSIDNGDIGVATAATPAGPFVKAVGNPILSRGAGAAWDSGFVRGPSPVSDGAGGWLMAYSGALAGSVATTEQIGYATAPALTGPWTKHVGNPILAHGSLGAWDDVIVGHPHLWFEPPSFLGGVAGKWAILYTGAAGAGGATPGPGFPWGVGIATADTPAGPWTKHVQNPFLPPGGAGAWDEGGPFRGGVWTGDGAPYTIVYAALNIAGTIARSGTASVEFVADVSTPVGWDSYAAADPNGSIVATIQRDDAPIKGATERSVRIELNGPGSGTFKINRYSSVALEAVLAPGNLIKCKFPWRDDYDFAFILEKGDFKLADAKEHAGEEFTFSGRGALAYLDRAIMDAVAYTTGLDVTDKLVELWHATVPTPVGVAFLPADTGHVYAISARTRRIYKVSQTTHKIVGTSPVLWSGSDNYAAGLTADPSNAAILWALEAPATLGGSGNTKIRKIDISGAITSWNVSATFDLGSAIQLSDIRASTASLVTTNYSTGKIQKRSKTTGAVTSDYTVTYKGVAQTHPNGTAISDNGTGTEIAMWFGGSSAGGVKKALVANLSNPAVVTRTIDTSDIASFGGDWSLESAQTYFYMVSYTLGRLWKYQLTAATPHDPVDGKWRLDEEFPGAILWRIIQEATAAGRPQQPLPDLDYDFTETLDSAAAAWSAHDGTKEFDAAIGDSVLATALRLIPYGLVEQMTPNLELIARNASAYGTDRTATAYGAGKVRFVKGDNIIPELGRQERERPLHSHMLATGKNNLYERAVLADLGYVREGFVGTDLADTTALEGTAEATLADERVKAERLRFRVIAGDDETAGRYRPFTHYNVGDLVTLDTGSGEHDFDNEPFILYAVTLEEDKAGKFAAPVIELGSATLVEAVSSSGGSSGSAGGAGGTVVQTTSDVLFQGTDETGAVVTSASGRTIRSTAWQVFQRGTGVIEAVLTAAGRLLGLEDVDADGITDGQVLVRDDAADTFIPGNVEDVATAELDTTLVLKPDGAGGLIFDTEDVASGYLLPDAAITSTKAAGNPTFAFNAVPEGKIIKVGATYYCPYTTSFGGSDGLVWLATAASPDGPWSAGSSIFNETSIAWRSGGIMYAPYVVEHDGTFYLFYSLIQPLGATSALNAIGMATASAITGPYTDHGSAVFAPDTAGTWDSRRVGEQSVIVRGGRWIMAYMGESSLLTYQTSEQIGTATADAPEGPWTRSPLNPVLPLGAGGAWDDAVVADPDLDFIHGHFVIMYAGGPTSPFPHGNDVNQGLAFATDPDGPWTRYAANPVLLNGGAGTFDEALVFRGSIYHDEDGWHGVYCGYNLAAQIRGGSFVLDVAFVGDVPVPIAMDVEVADAGDRFEFDDVEGVLVELADAETALESSIADVAADVATLAAIDEHVHVVDETLSGDGATTLFVLSNEAAPDSVMAWVAGVRTPVTLGGTSSDEITFGAAPAAGTDNVSVDYAAVLG